MNQFRSIADLEERVRSNMQPAAITAGLLILFGFFAYGMPEGDTLFSKANLWLVYALRIGGIAMVIVAIWSSIGHGFALLADAVVSMAVGAVLVVTGVLMLIDGGGALQNVIIVICGIFFTTTGIRNGQAFCEAARLCRSNAQVDQLDALGEVFGPGLGEDSSVFGVGPSSDAARIQTDLVEMPQKKQKKNLMERGGRFAVQDETISLADLGVAGSGDAPTTDPPAVSAPRAKPRGDEGSPEKPPGRGTLADDALAEFAEDDAQDTP
ncbi:MAG: hypothetical protein ACE5E5_11340 [Phycisphaerae bacterium]